MRLATLLLILTPCVWAAADPALLHVNAVYLMPMGSGLDQYLANQLTSNRVFEVVTDPALADAVFTDRLGPAFEQALAELYPPPPPPQPAETKEEAKPETKSVPAESTSIGAALAERPDVPARSSSFSRGKGNVFLVDRRTKRVLWSDFRTPTNSRAEEINRMAEKLVERLASDRERLQKQTK